MSLQTRTQKLSGRAFEKVRQVAQSGDDKVRKAYRTRALGFPAMLLQSGLAQAVGFLRAKAGEPDYDAYLRDLAQVLGVPDGAALQQQAIKAELADYRRLTQETLEAATLIKRFCQSELADPS